MAIMGYLTTFETGPAPRSEAKIPIYRDSNLPDHQDGQVKPCPYSATLWGGRTGQALSKLYLQPGNPATGDHKGRPYNL